MDTETVTARFRETASVGVVWLDGPRGCAARRRRWPRQITPRERIPSPKQRAYPPFCIQGRPNRPGSRRAQIGLICEGQAGRAPGTPGMAGAAK